MLERMVMTKAPLRITFVGGGTDLPFYYENRDYGAVVSAAINKYIYVTVNRKFDRKIRVSYSKTEIVDHIDEIQHPTVRESLRLLNLTEGIEIVSISDIPSNGTGLGSSSTFLVSLLHALHSYRGELVDSETLAKEAVLIEREVLKEPGGKQDQYAAAFGNLNLMKFFGNGTVSLTPVTSHVNNIRKVEDSLLLLYTGKGRSSSGIHEDQVVNSKAKMDAYDAMKELTGPTFKAISEGDVETLGRLVHENWSLKRNLSKKISDEWIDQMYQKAMELGAYGGKIVGAGGGGFMLLVAEPAKHELITKSLGLERTYFRFTHTGSRVIFVGE
ncbi:MAG: kinase [Candidatus Thermoplasmatota archaeon]|nr:kinase [Candidatus Thermoplasmatota archaeon]